MSVQILRGARRALLTLMAAATLATAPVADAMEKEELIEAVEARYGKVDTLSADFVQVSRSELFGDETESGHLLLKRPDKMRWSFGSDKVFVTDGKKMWIYAASENQVIEYDDISEGRSTADELLTSLDKINDLFHIKVLESTASRHRLELTPNETGQFKKVVLTLDASMTLQKVIITDTFDNVTEISFSNVKTGVSIPDSKFTFTVPAGADVVKANN